MLNPGKDDVEKNRPCSQGCKAMWGFDHHGPGAWKKQFRDRLTTLQGELDFNESDLDWKFTQLATDVDILVEVTNRSMKLAAHCILLGHQWYQSWANAVQSSLPPLPMPTFRCGYVEESDFGAVFRISGLQNSKAQVAYCMSTGDRFGYRESVGINWR